MSVRLPVIRGAPLRYEHTGVRKALQEMIADGFTVAKMAKEFGISEDSVETWIGRLEEEMRMTVKTDNSPIYDKTLTAHQALIRRQFDLFDKLHEKTEEIDEQIKIIADQQRSEGGATPQNAMAIFAGYRVIRGYLERMGEMLGQLKPEESPSIQMTRIEQLLNVQLNKDQIPEHLHKAVFGTDLPQIPQGASASEDIIE